MENRTVLVCPLDWGIGHATRCVPVIRILQQRGWRVVVAASGRPLEFLKKEFPGIPCADFPGIKIRYPKNAAFAWRMIRVAPRFLVQIFREHAALKKILKKEPVSLVISDNRYGLWSSDCRTVLITHQLSFDLPHGLRWSLPLLEKAVRFFAGKFDECWIPDFEQPLGLAGRLSHPEKLPPNASYIGILSRFSRPMLSDQPAAGTGAEILVLLSGPEPQRTILEQKLLRQLKRTDLRTAVIRGITEKEGTSEPAPHITMYNHLKTGILRDLINEVLVVIGRSGYSTIMDLVTMGKRAIFIPTPGQTEQEYLSRHLMDKKIFFSMSQESFDLIYALELSRNYPGMVLENDYAVLERAIEALETK